MVRRRWVGGLAVMVVVVLAVFAAGSLAQRPSTPPSLLNLQLPQEARKGTKSADPMADVETVLDRNCKEADTAIQALSDEAESLRGRLQKVEAALARWQSVAGALNQESGTASSEPARRRPMSSSTPGGAPSPEALPPAGRVRWRQPDPSPAKHPAEEALPLPSDDSRSVPPPGDDPFKLPEPGSVRTPVDPILPPVLPPEPSQDPIPIPKPSTRPSAEPPPLN